MTRCANCDADTPSGAKRYTAKAKIPNTSISIGDILLKKRMIVTKYTRVCAHCVYEFTKDCLPDKNEKASTSKHALNSPGKVSSPKRFKKISPRKNINPNTSANSQPIHIMDMTSGVPIVMASGSPLTTHILDTAQGCPASNVPISVFRRQSDGWHLLAKSETNSDGRCPPLLTQDQFTAGTYKIFFDTGSYFTSSGTKAFYPYVEVVFIIEDPAQHHHVPLLLSPYGYSTYRGS